MDTKTAIFPGSFDPFTRGHYAIVEGALSIFDRIIIAIGHNVSKQGLLPVEVRQRLVEDIYRGETRVEVAVYTGMTGDFARKVGAHTIIRGVRTVSDFEYERTMEAANRRLFPDIATILLFTPPEMADISSSVVREIASFGQSVAQFMPEGIDIEKYLKR